MENNIKVELKEGNELFVRTGKAPDLLPEPKPVALKIDGQISAPAEFFAKREEEINVKNAHVIVNKDKGTIILVVGDHNELAHTIKGEVEESKALKDLKLGHVFADMRSVSNHIKKLRRYFEDKEKNMTLVSELRNFKAKVEKSIEESSDDRGNKSYHFDLVIDTKMPKDFVISLPILKGFEPKKIEVEICIQSTDAGIKAWLESLDSEEIYAEMVEEKIAEQLPTFQDKIVTIFQ